MSVMEELFDSDGNKIWVDPSMVTAVWKNCYGHAVLLMRCGKHFITQWKEVEAIMNKRKGTQSGG